MDPKTRPPERSSAVHVARSVLVVAVTTALLGVMPPAHPAPTWLPLDKVHTAPAAGPMGGPQATDIAIAENGDAVMVWLDCLSGTMFCDTFRLRASMRKGRFGRDWTPAATIAEGILHAPQVDVGGARAIVVWQQLDAGSSRTRIRTSSAALPGGTWSAPSYLSDTAADSSTPHLDLDRRGRGVVAWTQGSSDRAIHYRNRSSTGVWASVLTASGPGHNAVFDQIVVSVNEGGAALIGWMADTSPDPPAAMQVFARVRPSAGAAFGGVEPVSPSTDQPPALVGGIIDRQGDASLSWTRYVAADMRVDLESADRPSGVPDWTDPEEIDESSLSIMMSSYASSPDGAQVYVWLTFTDSTYTAEGRKRTASGTFHPVTAIPQSGSSHHLPQAATRNGRSIVSWLGTEVPGEVKVQMATGSMGNAGWGTVKELTPALEQPPYWSARPIGTDTAGNAVAVFLRGLDLLVSPLDGDGPIMAKLRVPRRARKGTLVRLSVAPFDVWSPLSGRTKWKIGSKTKFGNKVRHRFRRAKRYKVTVSRTDKRGNKTTVVRRIRVVKP